MTTVQTQAILSAYTPRDLSKQAWQYLREPAIQAVLSTEAEGESARVLLSKTVTMLQWHPEWDKGSTPDLNKLLAPHHIEAFCASRRRPDSFRPNLRRVARAIGAMPPRVPLTRPHHRSAARGFWVPLAKYGPFTALVAACVRNGRRLQVGDFQEIGDELVLDVMDLSRLLSTAALAPHAKLHSRRMTLDTAIELLRARDVEALPMSDSEMKKHVTPRVTPVRPMSRRAALAYAKDAMAKHEAAKTLRAGGIAPEIVVAEIPKLSAEITDAIMAFVPNAFPLEDWLLVSDATRQLATLYNPPSIRWIERRMGTVARFCQWVLKRPERQNATDPLRTEEVLAPGLVDEYIAGPFADRPDGTRSTTRSILRGVVRRAAPSNASPRLLVRKVQPPYSPYECASFVRLARNQPTLTTRRGVSAVVALGLGAGLSAHEQRIITPLHITELEIAPGSVGVFVRVEGENPRTVIVRSQYEKLLREALKFHYEQKRSPTDLLYGESSSRKNVTANVLNHAKTAAGTGVDIDPARLRSTWLVACMSANVPLAALLHASGLRSARTLVDLLPYCSKASEESIQTILQIVKDVSLEVPS